MKFLAVSLLLCAAGWAAKQKCKFDLASSEASSDYVRLVDFLSAERMLLDPETVQAIADFDKPVNPVDLMTKGSEAEKLPWRQSFEKAIGGGDFKWEEVRDCIAARVGGVVDRKARRDDASRATAVLPVPIKLDTLAEKYRRVPFNGDIQVVDGVVYLPVQGGGLAAIDLATFKATDFPLTRNDAAAYAPVFVSIKGRPHAISRSGLYNLKTGEGKTLWRADFVNGRPRVEEFGTRRLAFVSAGPFLGQRHVSVRPIDGKAGGHVDIPLHSAGSAGPSSGVIGGKRIIAWTEGGSVLRLLDPLAAGEPKTISINIGSPDASVPVLYEEKSEGRALVADTSGVHLVDLGKGKVMKTIPVVIDNPNLRTPRVFAAGGGQFVVTPTHQGVAIIDLAAKKVVKRIESPQLTSDVIPFALDGKTYLAWGTEEGKVTIASAEGEVLGSTKVAKGKINSLVPFVKGGKVLALVDGDDPPALVQLVGPKP